MKSFKAIPASKFHRANFPKTFCDLLVVVVGFYVILTFPFLDGISQTKCEFHTDNPVLKIGAAGSWDDFWLEPMSVVYDGESYRMWYLGFDSKYNHGIGYAVSTDGISWEKCNDNPILVRGTDGNWDDAAIFGGAVILLENTFYLWFNGGNKAGTIYGIGLATSSDGIHWTEYENNPVFEPIKSGSWNDFDAGLYPTVVFDGEGYHMWYGGCRNEFKQPGSGRYLMKIGYATSPDGITWTPYENNPVLRDGKNSSDWDYWKVEMPTVIKNHSGYHMWFHGDNAKSQIGYARSDDGINWTKCQDNPVLSPRLIGNWNLIGLMRPVAIYDEITHTYKMWFMGGSYIGVNAVSQIGYATSPEDTVASFIQNRSNTNIPDQFALYQNYPNPFNAQTTIEYQLPQAADVRLEICNVLGQRIATLVKGMRHPAHFRVTWDGKDNVGQAVPTGVYFYRIQSEGFTETKKMLLLQ